MKHTYSYRSGFRAASSICLAAALTASAWVSETPTEFIGDGDFDGDGQADALVLDKVTGAFRIGYQNAAGKLNWSESRASGITNVTGASIGRLLSTARASLAATSRQANRVNLLEASSAASPALPVSVYFTAVGPNMVAALDIGGAGNTAHDDLYVGSRENPVPGETLIRNQGTVQSIITEAVAPAIRSPGNSFVMKKSSPLRLGMFNRAATPNADSFVAVNLSSGAVVTELNQGVSDGSGVPPEFVAARFNDANSYAQVLFYHPSRPSLYKWQVAEPVAGTFSLTAAKTYDLGDRIQRVQLLASGTAPRLVVFFGESPTQAVVATVYDFDGDTDPKPVQSFTNLAGFTSLADLGGGNLAVLIGDAAGRSLDYQTWIVSGAGFDLGDAGTLPGINPYAGSANVLLFSGEPLVNPGARPLKSLKAGDWSSSLVLGGGAPPTVNVTAERYAGMSNGLQNPTTSSLGAAPSGTTHGLVNQYTNPISIFSRRSASGDLPAEVAVSPVAGEYAEAIQVRLTVSVSGWVARYRLSPGSSWQTYSGPFFLFTNATVEFYARETPGTRNTAIQTAAYRFIKPGGQMDSDGDGVPDAVELAYGLDPLHGGADSDGDGHTDLEEIVRGTDPNNKFSYPSGFPALDFGASFDLITTPRALNSVGNHTLSITGTVLHAWSLGGAAFAQAQTTNYLVPGVTNPAAWLSSITPGSVDRLVIQATDSHFDLNVAGADKRLGRELIGLIVSPRVVIPSLPPVDLSLGAGAVGAWVSSAAALVTGLHRPTQVGDLTYRDTLVSALVEAKVAQVLLARGTNAATNLTLFPFRSADAGRFSLSVESLAGVESYISPVLPAYKWSTLLAYFQANLVSPPSSEINTLRALAAQLCQISAAYNNTNPAAFKLPLDEFRRFIRDGTLSPGYLSRLANTNLLPNAWLGVSNLLAGAPPRPVTNLMIRAVGGGSGPISFMDVASAQPVSLWDKNGKPLSLPPNFELLPDSRLALFGHPDIDTGQPGISVEVVSLFLTSVPASNDLDGDGNLLVDSWENLFFGGTGVDPFADSDGDGFSNVQEMLMGTDPNSAGNYPVGLAAHFELPNLNIVLLGGSTKITFHWPADFISSFNFGMKTATDLGSGFGDYPVGTPVSLGGDLWEITFTPPPAGTRFYYLTLGVK